MIRAVFWVVRQDLWNNVLMQVHEFALLSACLCTARCMTVYFCISAWVLHLIGIYVLLLTL